MRADGQLCRLVVTRELALACLDRASTWRTLQELAGVHNEHVEAALSREQDKAATAESEKRDELETTHRTDLERVQEVAVGEAMRGLAISLLSLDPDAFIREVTATPASSPLPTSAVVESEAAAPTPPETEAPVQARVAAPPAIEGPWVESALCTTCDDCLQINRLLFVYDENKQIRIGDPRAGTYAQLVRAAEKCPARCIHPGEPLDPSEKGLEALRRRAEPF